MSHRCIVPIEGAVSEQFFAVIAVMSVLAVLLTPTLFRAVVGPSVQS